MRAMVLLQVLVTLAVLTMFTGCAAMHESKDYVRHTNSALVKARDGSNSLQFQARAGADFPEDDPEAEALRITWLEGWLEQRKVCPNGYRIDKRRPFGFTEHNPAQFDLVYEIECTSPPATE